MLPKIKAEPYEWPSVDDISPSNTALIVIDMQNDCKSICYLSALPNLWALLTNLNNM